MNNTIQDLDLQLLQFFNGLGSTKSDPLWLCLTNPFVWIPLFVLLIIIISIKYPKKQALIFVLGCLVLVVLVMGITGIVKNTFVRVRPCNVSSYSEMLRTVIYPKDYSFFSGHAASSTAITTYFISLLKTKTKFIYLLIIWAAIFMFSRLYFAAHYPSDILIGILVGFSLSKLALIVIKKYFKYFKL